MGRVGSSQAVAAFRETLRSPNLRRAQASFGFAWATEWTVMVAVGILAFRDGGAAAVGIVGMARLLPGALLAPFAATLVDRHRRERVLVAVGVIRGSTLGAAALWLALTGAPVPAYALVALSTLAHTLYRPAHSALLPSLSQTPRQLTSANAVRGMLDSLSALLGPLAAGVLVGPIGVDGVLGVAAAAALLSAWLIGRVHYEAPPRLTEVAAGSRLREAAHGLTIIARQPDLRFVTIVFNLQTLTRGFMTVFSVVIALELLGTGEAGVGLLTAAFGAGAVLGSLGATLLVGSTNFARWSSFGIALWGAPFLLLAGVSNEFVAYAIMGLVGVANAVVDLSGFTLLQRIVPDEVMGRCFASLESLFTLFVALGSLVAPGLIALFGIRGGLVAAGLVAPVGVALAWRRMARLDADLRVGEQVMTVLRRVPMLEPLPMSTLTALGANAAEERVPAGTTVIHEGDSGDEFYVIVEGQAAVSVDGAPVNALGADDCFGEIAALGRRKRTSTVRAETDLELLRLSGAHFMRAVTGYTPSSSQAAGLVEERLARGAKVG